MPSNPVDAWLQMAQMKNQNRRQMYGDMAGIGQGLGEGFNSIGQAIGEQKKKALLQQIMQQMKNQQTPIQGPAGYAPPNQGPNSSAVPAGQKPPPNPQAMNSLFMQADPQGMIKQMMDQQDPYKKALTNQAMSEAEKNRRPSEPKPEWSAVSGMSDKQGNPIELDKFTGQMKAVPIPGGTKSTGYGSTMGPIRQAQYTLQDLPSNQGPSTAGGAAYQVLVGSQQGMNLIAKAGSTQRTGLAQADLARSVIRSTPTDEALKNANFSDNFITKVGQIRQRITSDPTAISNPQIRKEMYTIFKEMRESSRPFIQNQLDDMEAVGFPLSPSIRKRQLGDTLPVIPFQEGGNRPQQAVNQPYSDPGKEARYQSWKKSQGL